MKVNLLLILLLVISINGFCQDERPAKIRVFPQFAYTEETGFWGGLISYYRYSNKSIPDKDNQFGMQVVYTQKKQLQLKLSPEFHFRNGKSKLELETSFMKWPSEFYGIANTDPEKKMSNYIAEMFGFELNYKSNFKENLYYFLYSDQQNSKIIDREEPNIFVGIPGNEHYFLSGLGLGVAFDSRDAISFSTSGIYANLSIRSYRDWWGSDYNYENIVLDLRQFLGLGKTHVLAFQQYFSYNSDIAPFYRMFKLGQSVRAFQDELFLNNHGITLRAEYRLFPFNGRFFERFGFAAFFDTGQGMQDLNELAFSKFRCSVGAGIRFSIFVEDRFNLRFDYGKCNSNGSVNIGGGETF